MVVPRIKISLACRDLKINHEKQTKGSIFKSRIRPPANTYLILPIDNFLHSTYMHIQVRCDLGLALMSSLSAQIYLSNMYVLYICDSIDYMYNVHVSNIFIEFGMKTPPERHC